MRKLLIFFSIALAMTACHKDKLNLEPPKQDTIPAPPVVDTPKTHVYISGNEVKMAFYWKDSTIVYLTDGQNYNLTTSIFVKDTDVYVGGSGEPAAGMSNAAKYWKNGTAVQLTDGSRYGIVNDIFVDDKDNVYACGWEQSAAGYNDMHWIAIYWVNGKQYILSDSTVGDAVATAITADKAGNVYVAWWQFGVGGPRLGYYSKNQEKHFLNKNEFEVYPFDIAQLDGDIYVTGFTTGYTSGAYKSYAGYWKNGQLKVIDSTRNAWPVISQFKEGDIYLLGKWDTETPNLWHNGQLQALTIDPSGMSILDHEVYISGTVYSPKIDYFVPGICVVTDKGVTQRELPLDEKMQLPVATGIFVK